MSMRPAVSVTLGNLRYDAHAAAIDVCLGLLPRGGSFEVHLPAAVRFDAAPGDSAQIDVDGGEGSQRVLTGSVREVRRSFDGVVVQVHDAGGALAQYRPSVTFENQSAADIVRRLASDVGITVRRADVDLEMPAYVAHPAVSAAEHIAMLCRLGGALARVAASGDLEVIPRPAGPPDTALRYGRELTEYRAIEVSSPNATRFAIGFGPAGSSSDPNSMKQTKSSLPGSARPGGVGVVREARALLRTAGAASDASTALQEAAAAASSRLEARGFLLPSLRPGDVVEVQSLPGGLTGGPWLLTRVTHRLEPRRGGVTTIEAESADTASLLGQLVGAALSAVGGLL